VRRTPLPELVEGRVFDKPFGKLKHADREEVRSPGARRRTSLDLGADNWIAFFSLLLRAAREGIESCLLR
jgi:hypothetical protein